MKCWCGETLEEGDLTYEFLDRSCGGSGTRHCRCGGDLCVCHLHDEVECPGCDDCNQDDDLVERRDDDDEDVDELLLCEESR